MSSLLQAVLFDLDGTLVDSEPIYRSSDKAFLAAKGITVPEALWPSFVGMGAKAFIQRMKDDFGLTGDLDALVLEKDSYFQALAKTSTRAFDQVVALNAIARAAGLKTAVASGSNPEAIRASLAFAGIGEPFDLLLSSSQVARSKPAPDVFLEAARRLGVEPGACLVVEDSVYGAMAGLAAGMYVLAMPYEESHRDHEVYDRVPFLHHGNAGTFNCDDFVGYMTERGLWPT